VLASIIKIAYVLTLIHVVTAANAVPSFKVAAIYPDVAFQKCIEGYAVVRYKIDLGGKVVEFSVIDSDPRSVFDDSAIRATQELSSQKLRQLSYEHLEWSYLRIDYSMRCQDGTMIGHCRKPTESKQCPDVVSQSHEVLQPTRHLAELCC